MKSHLFNHAHASLPDLGACHHTFNTLETALRQAKSPADCAAIIEDRDRLWREVEGWYRLTELRFQQDTTNADFKRAFEDRAKLVLKMETLDRPIVQQLVICNHRPQLEARFGKQAFALWENELKSTNPIIEQERVAEKKWETAYDELTASAEFTYQENTYNMWEFVKFLESPDRDNRYQVEQQRWQWYANNRERLDRIFDELVQIRHTMARKLGYKNFIELGYLRMQRISYGPDEVARFRKTILQKVTPLATALRQRQAETLGVNELMFWDEPLLFPGGNPAPLGDADWLVERAQEMFDAMSNSLGAFFRMMVNSQLLDLKARKGKSNSVCCNFFPNQGLPFIMANFNGTKTDMDVFTHEIGHAFQSYQSRSLKLSDYFWPTYDAAEIHSMSLELLTRPYVELFFENEADQFREAQLMQILLALPWGAAVDHFQHEIYANPFATPSERFTLWKELEALYLPWRQYGDLPHLSEGGLWQARSHIFLSPFYLIDYCLAQTCALQLWMRSKEDYKRTLNDWEALCCLGGSLCFLDLLASANLVSPFDESCFNRVVEAVCDELNLQVGFEPHSL